MTSPHRPFADAVVAYAQAGWPAIMPVPVGKHPPPVGFTGAEGRDTDPLQLTIWAGTHAEYSIALRMPDGVIGIDVDHYVKGPVVKRGADVLAELEERYGPLPATWSSTARGADNPSRIRFYRVPAGRYRTKFTDIEIIQRHHRYAVVWPSPHTDVGDIYRWYDPDGQVVDAPPKPLELPELPASWIEGLREGATDAGPASADLASGEAMLAALRADERPGCSELVDATLRTLDEVRAADAGSRHDTMTGRVHHLVQLGAAGHPGVGTALALFALQWGQLTAGEDRAGEYDRMLLTSARKAVTVVGPRPVPNDPCMLIGDIPVAEPAAGGPAPGDDRKGHDDPEPIEAPRDLHPQEVIGTELFTPRAQLDQRLADAVLERMWPVLRYGYDEGSWLLRERVAWSGRSDLAEWAIAQVAEMMPRGNPDAEKGSDDRDAAERRKRLMSAGPAGAIAKKMRARVAGGSHPCALRISDLDTEPWLLWAGGVGWDLTASHEHPAPAGIDPATPHLRSAGVAPETRPTPLWDAFVTAVWPDPALRAWALRVLSITLTGYADRALPILLGERGRGKTQIVTLLMSVLGNYAHAADPRLLNGLDNAHASIIYALKGRRLSFIDEGPREGRLGQERLKQLTGGGALTGNQMNRNPITFTPTHTLVLTSNDDPVLTDPAIRDRVRLIPCEGDPDQVRDARRAIGHTRSATWRREAPGVLAALMREAAAWLAHPETAYSDAAPAAYQERVEQLVAQQDPVRTWVDEETDPDPAGERSRVLYEAFVGWCRTGNTNPSRIPTETRWGMDLNRLGYPAVKHRDGNHRALRIRPRTPWATTPTPPAGGDPAGPLPEPPAAASGVEGSWTVGGGLAANPPHGETPIPAGTDVPEMISVEGVEGQTPPYAHVGAHARTHVRTHETRPETAPNPPIPPPLEAQPAAPESEAARITRRLLEGRPAPFAGLGLAGDRSVTELPPGQRPAVPGTDPERVDLRLNRHGVVPDAAYREAHSAELAERARKAAPAGLLEPPPPPDRPVDALSPAQRVSLEYHELRRQQDLRVEAATRGALHDHRGRDSEEVLTYFGEGEFEGSGTEQRLTWARFLEQRRPDREHEKARNAAWEAGARLGRKHAAKPTPDADADYSRTAKGHDEDTFSDGYTAGILEYSRALEEAGGPWIELPALVTRDGTVQHIPLDQARDVIKAFGGRDELTVDVETTGYPVGHADYALRTVQLGGEHAAIVLDATDPEHMKTAGELLGQAAILHAHSATADLVPLAAAGAVDLDDAFARMQDTVIPAKLADPASTGSDPGLKKLAAAVLREYAMSPAADDARAALFKAGKWLTDTKTTTPIARSGWAQVDSRCTTMIRYAASDVLDDAALAHRLPPAPLALIERERTAQLMTARVTHRGLAIDGDRVQTLLDRERAGLTDAAARLATHGVDNPGSDAQVGTVAVKLGAKLPRTPTGRTSVAAGALEPYRRADGPLGDFVRARLDYQRAETAIGLILEPYHQLVARGDGRARPTVYTLAADTGRMSCLSMDSLIEMPRDLAKHPHGVPITEVQAGDWVYAFDHNRELALKRVKWCAQTGVRQTLIITAQNGTGHRITLRATPEHLIRLRNGDWRATENLMHAAGRPHREDGPRLMTMVRRQVDAGYVKFFPHSVARKGAGTTGGGRNREHRWVLEQITGRKISTKIDVNHIDGNRANNHPDNLQELPMQEHRGNRDLAWGVTQDDLELPTGPTDYRVISVEPGFIEPVWDMEVEDVHNFIANGICVHNCVRPNLQQVPREGGYRACVTADPGTKIVSADFAGVELRVAAALSGDTNLRRLIAEEDAGQGDGVHWAIARLAFGPDATKADRYATKRGVFGRIYGGGIAAIAAGVGVSETVAAAIVDALDAMLPELTAWSAAVRDAVKRGHTQFPTYSGRVVHLPRAYPHKAPNYCIQGTARELLVDTLVRLRDTRWGTATLLPVHDEVLLVVPEADAATATADLVAAMETALHGIPIKAEASQPSFAWSDAS